MQPAPLADPSAMSPQQRTDELVKAVELDDLLGVLLVLQYAGRHEVNSKSPRTGRTPLATTLAVPLRRFDVRRLIAECLLLDGADPEEALRQRPASSTVALVDVFADWRRGGREQAVTAYRLRFQQTLEQAEAYIRTSGLGVDSLPRVPPPEPVRSARDDYRRDDPSRRPFNQVERSQPIAPPALRYHDSARRPQSPPRRPINQYSHDRHREPSPGRRSSFPSKHDPPRPPRRSLSPRRRAASPPRNSHHAPHPISPARSAVSQRRGFSPDRRVQPRSFHPPGLFWIFVGSLPRTVAERYIFEILEARGIAVGEIFMSQTATGSRFAFVGVKNPEDGRAAISSLHGTLVDGQRINAKPFRDAKTGSVEPEIGSGKSGPYVGTVRQANRTDDTRCGVTLMHVSPRTRPEDIAQFFSPVVPPELIERIDVRTIGVSTLAFCRLRDRETVRKVILEFDGKVFLGHAARVSWMEPDNRKPGDHYHTSFRSDRPSLPDQQNRAPPRRSPSPATKRRRLSQGQPEPSQTSSNEAPPPSSSTSEQPPPPTDPASSAGASEEALTTRAADPSTTSSATETAASATTSETANPASTDQQPQPIPQDELSEGNTGPAVDSQATDLDRLRTFGLEEEEVKTIEQAWSPSADKQAHDSFISLKANFGYMPQDEAKAALAANKSSPAFPEDAQRQQQFEAFLRAQAGESQEYYMTFLAQLANFNRTTNSFLTVARQSLASDGIGGSAGGEVAPVAKAVDGGEGEKAKEETS